MSLSPKKAHVAVLNLGVKGHIVGELHHRRYHAFPEALLYLKTGLLCLSSMALLGHVIGASPFSNPLQLLGLILGLTSGADTGFRKGGGGGSPGNC